MIHYYIFVHLMINFNGMFTSYHQQVARAKFSICKLLLWVMNLRARSNQTITKNYRTCTNDVWSILRFHSIRSHLRDEKHLTMETERREIWNNPHTHTQIKKKNSSVRHIDNNLSSLWLIQCAHDLWYDWKQNFRSIHRSLWHTL